MHAQNMRLRNFLIKTLLIEEISMQSALIASESQEPSQPNR